MQQKQEPKLAKCEHCQKQIQSHKIDMHFGYCVRNFKRCSKCLLFYDKNYEEQHINQMHQQIKCQHCDHMFQKDQYQLHKKQCGPKFIICASCDQKVPEIMFKEHEKICAARTIECEICHRPFQMQKFKDHQQMCLLRLSNPELYPEQECYGSKKVKQQKPAPRSIATEIFNSNAQRVIPKQKNRLGIQKILQPIKNKPRIQDFLQPIKNKPTQRLKKSKQETQVINLDDDQQLKSTSQVVEQLNKKKDNKNKKQFSQKPSKQNNNN